MTDPFAERVLHKVARRSYYFWERRGLHVTPVHFYSPLPDTRLLDRAHWETPTSLVGIDMRPDAQKDLLSQVHKAYAPEYGAFPRKATGTPGTFYMDNDMFVSVDAEMLYSLVRRSRPTTVIEAGSGFSSLLIEQALAKNETEGADACTYTVFDPYAGPYVKQGLRGTTRLEETAIERVPFTEFESLGENDILFIDSSHALRVAGDVQYLFLEVLPRLAPGVIVHVHDVFLPYDYPVEWVLRDRKYWSEQYLLQAFLAFNDAWEVLWAGSYMHVNHPERLSDAFPSYRRGALPGSFWMRRLSSGQQDGRGS